MLTGSLPLLGAAAAGILALFLAPLIFRETRRARVIDRRLAALRGQSESTAAIVASADPQAGGTVLRGFGIGFMRALSVVVPVGAAERGKLEALLRRAGYAHPDALSVFLSVKIAFALVFGAVVGIASSDTGLIEQGWIVAALGGLVGFVVGGILPEYALRMKASGRVKGMQAALPDALDMMVMCLETGLTVERGILTVAEELMPIEPELAKEFQQIEAEIRVGADRRAVLEEYYERTEIEGLGDFAMALIQSDRYGTPLSQSMKSIASDARLQRAARIDTAAQRLPVLMTLPMLVFVVPGTMLLVAGPPFMTAMSSLQSFTG